MIGLIVFSGSDPISKMEVRQSAFEKAISNENSVQLWESAIDLQVLGSHQVRCELWDADDEVKTDTQMIAEANELSFF